MSCGRRAQGSQPKLLALRKRKRLRKLTTMLPGPERWLFSLKTFAAAMLALSICLWLDLYRPYWAVATVYIASRIRFRARRGRRPCSARWDASAAAILLVPNLAQRACAACARHGALVCVSRSSTAHRAAISRCSRVTHGGSDRFSHAGRPGHNFGHRLVAHRGNPDSGILCAVLVSSLVFPRRVGPVIALKLKNWFHHADTERARRSSSRTRPLDRHAPAAPRGQDHRDLRTLRLPQFRRNQDASATQRDNGSFSRGC